MVEAKYSASGKDWQVSISIEPGEPVRVRELNISVEGPGADDPAFDPVKNQDLIRVGTALRHGAYEGVKSEMTRIAASNGYLASQMSRTVMEVDVAAPLRPASTWCWTPASSTNSARSRSSRIPSARD